MPSSWYSNRLLFYTVLVAVCASSFFLSGCASEDVPDAIVDVAPQSATPALSAAPSYTPPPVTSSPLPLPASTPPPTETPVVSAEPTPKTQRNYPVADTAFYYQDLDDALKARITGMSYPLPDEPCAISYSELCYIGILYCDFAGETHTGELIVNKKLADEVVEIFYELYQNQYPLSSVRLVDDYGEPGHDNRSMAANNTSAFNYRRVTGSKTLSRHSYGAAIDVNPLFNPYIDKGRIAPPEAAPYADRDADFPGKIDHEDLCYRLFTRNGWSWGGDWSGDKDYQHFSKDIGY